MIEALNHFPDHGVDIPEALQHDTEVQQHDTQPKHPPLRRAAVAAAGFTLLLSGCYATSDTQETPSPTPSVSADPVELFESPDGECNRYADNITQSEAKACLAVYEDTDIAFVNFTELPNRKVKQIADDTEKHIKRVTHGMINADVVAMPASEAAVDLFNEKTPDGCVDLSFSPIENYASYIAAAAMPELEEYDKIVGITNTSPCAEDVNGIAFIKDHNRYTEIFNVEDGIEAVRKNGGEYMMYEKHEGYTLVTSLPNFSLVGAHEVFHLLGLGHSGVLYRTGDAGELEDVFSVDSGSTDARPVDLDKFIQAGTYDEYGNDNAMGNPSELDPEQTLDAPQTYVLEWPHRQLGLDTQLSITDIASQPATFSKETSETATAAIVQLEMPIFMPREDAEESAPSEDAEESVLPLPIPEHEKFSTIVFQPKYEEDGAGWALKMFVLGNRGSAVDVGSLYKNGMYQIPVEDKMIRVEITDSLTNVQLADETVTQSAQK